VIEQAGADVPGGMPTVRRFGGRAFFDITLMQWLTCHCFGIPPVEVTRTMGGAAPELPIDPKSWTAREKLACGGRGLRIFRRFLRLEREFEGEVRRLRAVVQAEAGRDVQAATTKQLGERLRELGRATSEFQEHFMIASSMSGAWTQQLNEVLGRAVGERASSLASGLLAGTGGVESAEHGYGLIELARLARGDEAARSYLTARPRDPAGWRALPAGPFREAFAQYLEKFGHRSVYEADLANPRWAEDPSYLLDQIEALLGAPEQDRAAAARGRRAAAESELEQLPFWWRVPARWLARKAATGAGTREAAKSALSLGMLPTRRILVEVGRRLAESGKLESAHDVFELAVIEIDGILREEWDGSGARTLAGRRKAQRARWLAEAPPPDCVVVGAGGSFEPIGPHGEGLPEGLRAPESAKVRATDGWLPGLPLSAGTARGTARVIRHPEEGLRLQHGEVLVAPSTDPAWTPLFLRASALVMETGGYLSHGAIVAREYGLPAVANVPALFEHVTDGRSLTVDGGAGRIKVES
jgi:phosphohistidine swiveling domain-containing protein